MSDDALILRTVDENDPLDNERGVTYRVKQETGTPDNKRGVTYRVKNVGGGSATIDPLSITPSTSAQTITASGGTDGYSPVNVAAVDASIDANIVAGNIKKDVSILGVTGSYEGTTPTGTMYIISNGTYNVADKAIANVQVPTTAPAHYIEKTVDANGKLNNSSQVIDLTGATDIGDYVLDYAYRFNSVVSSVDFSSLTAVSGNTALSYCFSSSSITSINLSNLETVSGLYGMQYCCYHCDSLTSFNLSKLKTISGDYGCQTMFSGCTHITTADLSSLETISGTNSCKDMFNGCIGLTSVNLSNLKTISGVNNSCQGMFQGCTGLTTVDMSSLTDVTGGWALRNMFQGCTSLTTVYIGGTAAIDFGNDPSYKFSNMFMSTSQNITVYAPKANQSTIEGFSGYPNFGNTGTVTWVWRE